jgi:hypothetical protein
MSISGDRALSREISSGSDACQHARPPPFSSGASKKSARARGTKEAAGEAPPEEPTMCHVSFLSPCNFLFFFCARPQLYIIAE